VSDDLEVGIDWERIARQTLHPIKVKILEALASERKAPSELAPLLGESLGTVSYHCSALKHAGAIELVETEPVRGALKHYYELALPGRSNAA
jgi:DNA-binding transcriptional ArsR family regulator